MKYSRKRKKMYYEELELKVKALTDEVESLKQQLAREREFNSSRTNLTPEERRLSEEQVRRGARLR